MALITVAELLFDPDFVDPCVVLRQIEQVGQDGIARRVVVPIQILASIQAAEGDALEITTDLARTRGSYECITTFPLNEATETTAADIVLWQGMQFTVMTVGRFGNFANGLGHYEAVMDLKPVRAISQPQTTWVDNSLPTTWVDNGMAVFWDVPGAQPGPTTTRWTDGAPATWRDDTTTTVWDVST